MNEKTVSELVAIARSPEQELPARIAALRELAAIKNKVLVPELLAIWKRSKTTTEMRTLDWDPVAVERVVDLYTILALHKHQNSSLLPEIAGLVRQAGAVLTGPYNELTNAAVVISEIKALGPVDDLVHLAGDLQANVVANAVRTLQLLRLPDAPTGGSVPEIPALRKSVSFVVQRFSEELTTIARISDGAVVLSPGTQEFMRAHDYDRGRVVRTNTSIAEILTLELDLLDVTYAVVPNRVEICTFREAGTRWRQAWPAYRNELVQQGWTDTPPGN